MKKFTFTGEVWADNIDHAILTLATRLVQGAADLASDEGREIGDYNIEILPADASGKEVQGEHPAEYRGGRRAR